MNRRIAAAKAEPKLLAGRLAFVPRYYFHLLNDLTVRDEEGIELPNLACAMQHAAASARDMAAQSVRQGHLVLDHRIEVTDDTGAIVGIVHFRDVVEILD
jgi:uncharacterized protein DUF6894